MRGLDRAFRHVVPGRFRQSGLTIVELMVACTVGLLVVLALGTLLLSSKAAYSTQDDNARLQETGRFALELMTRAVHQAAYENWDQAGAALVHTPEMGSAITGLDGHSLSERPPGIDKPLTSAVNGSDVLALQYFGSGAEPSGDGIILNCAGFGVPAWGPGEADRGWSIFFVGRDQSGEPELRCKYRGKSGWNAEAIARGVESFQVLYGIDSDGDGLPNQFLNADGLDRLDESLTLEGPNAVARVTDLNRKTHWKKVVALKIALLISGEHRARASQSARTYDLFGADYADQISNDIGTRIAEADLPPAQRKRLRRVFSRVVQLRSRPGGTGT